jgi:predicted Rossmann fold flavoprotein
MLHTKALDIITSEDSVTGIRAMKDGEEFFLPADRIVVASGGLSYPSTGSDGDGYRFAEKTGHRITKLYPSLVPIVCREESVRRMQGLSLKNVELVVCSGKKILFSEFGEMMFTHFGITGPLVLSASACIGPMIGVKDLKAWINLKPAISEMQFDQRLLRLFEENPNKELKNILGSLYPSKLQDEIPLAAGIDPEKKIHDITREERASLVDVTMHFPLTFTALRGYNEAVVTKGGISVKDVNPKTMESKVIRNLFFVGEVLDLDAFTGGYNLQIAWSTAACAAEAASVWE